MEQKPVICLTFDLEEFDLPLEYGQPITNEKQFEVTRQGMEVLLPLLDKHKVEATFFTTANFAQNNSALIKNLSKKHEIASHSFFHASFETSDLKKSKETLEEISGAKINGFRMPRMQSVSHSDLLTAGYKYDSSLHPTWLPGRYNHFSESKIIYKNNGLIVFPASVTPFFRTPLFWLSFKNFSSLKYAHLTEKCLNKYDYVNIYLHPWEFADLSAYKLPSYIVKNQVHMLGKLAFFLEHFQNKAQFISIKNFLQQRNDL
ncbi:MAG TPA: polysaccharide deacetylase family protein [Bacteroidia bacterium]|jgi:peptidoglycan/xylan/chitin deacetylase (PgdA/CDA1 family)|nr:polysaccharide deacetylase family protein [Bacteroidia bacterium]